MHHYRAALDHLNLAMDELIVGGDTLIAAHLALPIDLLERRLEARSGEQATSWRDGRSSAPLPPV